MPFGTYDHNGEVLQSYKKNRVDMIINLASENECIQKAGRDLNRLYTCEGFTVISLPINDFSVPDDIDGFYDIVRQVTDFAKGGKSVAIHCSGGIGRSGMFAACLVNEIFGLKDEEAIGWVRQYIPGAVETREQRVVANDYPIQYIKVYII